MFVAQEAFMGSDASAVRRLPLFDRVRARGTVAATPYAGAGTSGRHHR